jgi:hypothetical protein
MTKQFENLPAFHPRKSSLRFNYEILWLNLKWARFLYRPHKRRKMASLEP